VRPFPTISAWHAPHSYFKTSPEIIRPAVKMCVGFPLSLRNIENLLHQRCVKTVTPPTLAVQHLPIAHACMPKSFAVEREAHHLTIFLLTLWLCMQERLGVSTMRSV
jgi:hypothetical protein